MAKSSLFKRMNCFKPQNSEENPLILMNGKGQSQSIGGIEKIKSSSSLKTTANELAPLTPQQQAQLEQEQQQIPLPRVQDQAQACVQEYQDEIDQHNYQTYLNQLQNAQNFGNFMRENDRRQQQGQAPLRPPPDGVFNPTPAQSQQLPDVYFRQPINVTFPFVYYS